MADPISLIALGAAVGGAAGKFVEKAWDSGEKWITTYFLNHRPKAVEKAERNSADFLNELAVRIKTLEDQKTISKEQIENAQEHPDFSVTLQKAILTAAQTDDHQKHKILARILTERMSAQPEGLRAIVSKMACDAVGYITPNQLRLLALAANIFCINPTSPMVAQAFHGWLENRFSPYSSISFSQLDLLHLESLSCLKYTSIFTRDLIQILTKKNNGIFEPTILESTLGSHIKKLWDQGLQAADLTSVGQLIGVYVSDLLTNSNTSFSGWE